MRLLRLLLPLRAGGSHGRLHGGTGAPPDRGVPAGGAASGGHSVLWRRHPQLFGGEAVGEAAESRKEALSRGSPRRDHAGGQPRQRRGLEGPPDAAAGGLQPHLPGGPVHGRRLSPGLGPHPHMAAGAGGCGRLPEGQIPGRESGPDLRPAGADHGAVGKDPLRRPDPPAGASVLLRAEAGGGNAPLPAAGQSDPAGRRGTGGYVSLRRGVSAAKRL